MKDCDTCKHQDLDEEQEPCKSCFMCFWDFSLSNYEEDDNSERE